jgi:hypothetical protein
MTATFPQVVVEAGFAPTDPALGALDLILDDVMFGILDTDELADDDTWTDITIYVQDGAVTRQSTRQQGPFVVYQGGTATFTLNNSDGRFDPANLSGPYVAAGETQVRPMIPIRVQAIWDGVTYPVFLGFASAWTPPSDNFGPVYDQTVLTCGDGFRVLNGVTVPTVAAAGVSALSGARITRILAAAGWYDVARGMSVIDTGQSQMQAYTGGDAALNLLQVTADSEMGEIYMDASGRFTFRQRDAILSETRSTTVQGVFGGAAGTSHPDGTEHECTALSRPDDDTTMANDIQATIVGSSNMQEATDATSVSKYLFPRTYQRADLILTSDAQAAAWADYVLELGAADEFRFDSVTITPGVDPGNLFPQALGRELGDRIQVWKRPPGVTAYSKDLFIRGIQHTFTPTWWQTVWTPQNAARYSFFVLDDAVLGVLDTDALAW